jgi:hypothetical protein
VGSVYFPKLWKPLRISSFFGIAAMDQAEITLGSGLAQYGPDESNWPQTFQMATYAPWVTAEEIKDSERRQQEQIWTGVRLLKKYLS